MNYSSGNSSFSKHLKHIAAAIFLLLSSMGRSPEVEGATFRQRQPISNRITYLQSQNVQSRDFFYPLTSNIKNYNLLKNNQGAGQRFSGNNFNTENVDIGHGLEFPSMRKRQEYHTKRAEPQIPSRLLELIPDITLLSQLLESGLLRIDNEDQVDFTDGTPFASQSQRQKNLPGRGTTYNGFTPVKRRMGGGGGCLFHAGLAHNCDYKDLVGAVDETDHWSSDMSPGKKKKRRKRAAIRRNNNSKIKSEMRDVNFKSIAERIKEMRNTRNNPTFYWQKH